MTRVTKPFDAVLDRIRQERTDPQPNEEVLNALAAIGREAIERAAESKATGNITLNQMEAFGYGVYFGGERRKIGFLDKADYRGNHRNKAGKDVKGAERDPKRGRMGRSMALHLLRDYKPKSNWYELYIVNAMWYTAIHEHWGLQVLSQEIMSAAQDIAQQLGVSVFIDVDLYGGR